MYDAGEMSMQYIIRHFVATLVYRGRRVLHGLPLSVSASRPKASVRTPHEILIHVNEVLSFAHAQLDPSAQTWPASGNWNMEVERYFRVLAMIDELLEEREPPGDVCPRLLQGPLADAMLHLGQIGIFRRMEGHPVVAEDYYAADIQVGTWRSP